ncbi:MAG: ferredoxin [Acidobacteria bacterium]|jgi:2Fe-2S ferredoxin|nr:ferredoxin [Acidobacteriota bacterium]
MEAELKFERENIQGVAVVGTYLIDSARRLGIEIFDECGRLGLCDTCAVTIKSGAEFLTPPTKAEIELLSDERRKNGERLSCQAKIDSVGEIVVETKIKEEAEPKDLNEEYRKEFADLPLEKKIANLVHLEALTLNETFSFVMNSPYKIVGKVMDFLAQFGLKMEEESKDAKRPEEHKTNGNGGKSAEENQKNKADSGETKSSGEKASGAQAKTES